MNTTRIHDVTENRGQICNELLRSLPQWFGNEDALRRYVTEVETLTTLVAYHDNRPIGLLSLHHHNDWTSEIHIVAIHPDFHRQGIGRDLLHAAESYLRTRNVHYLSVKTLAPTNPDEHYARTRQFYFAMGFRPVEEFKTLWSEANPCLLMIKTLETS